MDLLTCQLQLPFACRSMMTQEVGYSDTRYFTKKFSGLFLRLSNGFKAFLCFPRFANKTFKRTETGSRFFCGTLKMLFSESLVNFRCSGFVVSMYLDQRFVSSFSDCHWIEKHWEKSSKHLKYSTQKPWHLSTKIPVHVMFFPRITGALSKTSWSQFTLLEFLRKDRQFSPTSSSQHREAQLRFVKILRLLPPPLPPQIRRWRGAVGKPVGNCWNCWKRWTVGSAKMVLGR